MRGWVEDVASMVGTCGKGGWGIGARNIILVPRTEQRPLGIG
jgi:hypothetical protein